ncbi:MAG: DUF1553 domain-containing protein [Planctomycetota bacterium]|nr:DUF1553 domain-containing protein [Planctomycetota bacterium]
MEFWYPGSAGRDASRVLRMMILLLLSAPLQALDVQPETLLEEEIPAGLLEQFENEIRPLLSQRCYSCHSAEAKQLKSDLRLDFRDGIRTGGERGPAVIPGDPAGSLLLRAVNGSEPGLSMPPGETLSTLEIQSLAQWIRTGASDPRDEPIATALGPAAGRKPVDMEQSRSHWAFLAVADPAPPEVQSVERVRDPIDAFILAALESNDLGMAPEASLEVLAQRANQLLTGLPLPWPRLQRLMESEDPQAFDQFVGELLDSSAFGERWARSWLDLARYADSNGLDENLAFGEAWRYRDYVIRSFNEDKPYDEFLIEQVAGDLLPETEDQQAWRDQRMATGFLVLGPKMLAEQDEAKLAIDVVDEQLDVTARTFLGMTVGCARCHDHKFDPIPARDYYAMAGIFRSTSTMENLKTVAKWREISLETSAEKQARKLWESQRAIVVKNLEEAKKELRENLEGDLPGRVGQHLLAATEAMQEIAIAGVTQTQSTSLGENRSSYGTDQIPLLHSVKGGIQQVTWELQVPHAGEWNLEVRYAAMEKRPMRLLVNGEQISKDALATVTGGWTTKDLRWETQATLSLDAGIVIIRLERPGAVPHLDRVRLVPAEGWPTADPILVSGWVDFLTRPTIDEDPLWGSWVRWTNLRSEDRPQDPQQVARWWASAVADQQTQGLPAEVKTILTAATPHNHSEIAAIYQQVVEAAEVVGEGGVEALPSISSQLRSTAGPWFEPLLQAEKAAPARLRVPVEQMVAALAKKDEEKPPAEVRAIGVQEGEVADLPVHIRGSHLRLAKEAVPRGALQITDHLVAPIKVEDGKSGRLELARWMADEKHPLTSRVAVNRIWLELFGEALVSTPSNFGFSGDLPSHPELLDRLAHDFVADGWSTKKMIRRILGTSTWRQQVIEDPVASQIDPENRLLWRQNRHRLRAEAVRDSVLAVSRGLDREMGGTLLMTGNRGYVTNDQSNNQARYDLPRRSIYLPVIRNAMYELFSAFDYNDPSTPISKRYSTVIAHQALFFLNSPMVLEAALAISKQVFDLELTDVDQVQEMHRRVLCREATEAEVERAILFVNRVEDSILASPEEDRPGDPQLSAWQAYCQALLASSEFLYLD